ncbi:8472_t:CDS:2, partial [Dentiscutata erythropus]
MSLETYTDSEFDVKIIVGNGRNTKEFKAHSTILSSRSLYFQRALSERWNNKKHGFYVFKNPNIYPNTFKIILDYIYKEETKLQASAETCLNLLAACDELELLDLAEYPSNPILSRVNTERNDNAIWSDKYHGPCFGALDLHMNLDRWSFTHADYYYRITNSRQFTVDEYEVFAVDNFNQGIISVVLKKILEFLELA